MALLKSRFFEDSVYLDVSQGLLLKNHTTTINVYKLNYAAIIFTISCFFIAIFITLYILCGKSTKTLKPAEIVVFYLTKTAFKLEHAELCMSLIEKENYDVNYIHPDVHLSLFLCACVSGNANLVSFMLQQGANVNNSSNFGDSAFYLAVSGLNQTKDFKILDILLNAGSDINCQNKSGFTALHLASSRGNLHLVKYLLKNGSDPSIATYESVFSHELALNNGYSDIVDYILSIMRRAKKAKEMF